MDDTVLRAMLMGGFSGVVGYVRQMLSPQKKSEPEPAPLFIPIPEKHGRDRGHHIRQRLLPGPRDHGDAL